MTGKRRRYGKAPLISLDRMQAFFGEQSFVNMAALFGSRARGTALEKSDYDFVVIFQGPSLDPWGNIAVLRSKIESTLGLAEEDFDLVDLDVADTAVLSGIMAGYQILKGTQIEFQRILEENQAKLSRGNGGS